MDKNRDLNVSLEKRAHDIAIMTLQTALNNMDKTELIKILDDLLKAEDNIDDFNSDSMILNEYMVAYHKSLNYFKSILKND